MRYKIFALSDSQNLGKEICNKLDITLGEITLNKFSDGEMSPSFNSSIRNQHVFIVGSLHQPHDNFVELLLTIDAAKRAGAYKVHVVSPYMAYARQDRKDNDRGAVGARVIAQCIENMGADSFMPVDLHAGQIEGFFSNMTRVVHIKGRDIFTPYFKKIVDKDWVVVSPDAGGVARAKGFSEKLSIPLNMMDKRRDKPNSIGSMVLIGDVKDKKVLLVDDMVDTAGTLCKSAEILLEMGAKEVYACITHGVLSGKAYERIRDSKLTKLYISDTIPTKEINSENIEFPKEKIEIISCTTVISKIINTLNKNESIELNLKDLELN